MERERTGRSPEGDAGPYWIVVPSNNNNNNNNNEEEEDSQSESLSSQSFSYI
jgi:hypothetical protein